MFGFACMDREIFFPIGKEVITIVLQGNMHSKAPLKDGTNSLAKLCKEVITIVLKGNMHSKAPLKDGTNSLAKL
jgi:hypothetical protein